MLFCDLVGSTALAARLDPEDMGRVIRAFQECCAEVVRRWDGHIARYMGDGMLAYFGWPRAHEDDAERAVRAGLELTAVVTSLGRDHGSAHAARVGIATGLVMVGDLIGDGAAQEETVVGETPNLAARLQAMATPGSVVIAEGTQRLVGGLFEYVNLGAQDLKGFGSPVHAWRVIGEGGAESRFEALHGGALATLVGREAEIGLLLDRWERAREGEGQVVLISGEPGIGKSRIVRALRERLAHQHHTPLAHYCSPYHTDSALYEVRSGRRSSSLRSCWNSRAKRRIPLFRCRHTTPRGQRSTTWRSCWCAAIMWSRAAFSTMLTRIGRTGPFSAVTTPACVPATTAPAACGCSATLSRQSSGPARAERLRSSWRTR